MYRIFCFVLKLSFVKRFVFFMYKFVYLLTHFLKRLSKNFQSCTRLLFIQFFFFLTLINLLLETIFCKGEFQTVLNPTKKTLFKLSGILFCSHLLFFFFTIATQNFYTVTKHFSKFRTTILVFRILLRIITIYFVTSILIVYQSISRQFLKSFKLIFELKCRYLILSKAVLKMNAS